MAFRESAKNEPRLSLWKSLYRFFPRIIYLRILRICLEQRHFPKLKRDIACSHRSLGKASSVKIERCSSSAHLVARYCSQPSAITSDFFLKEISPRASAIARMLSSRSAFRRGEIEGFVSQSPISRRSGSARLPSCLQIALSSEDDALWSDIGSVVVNGVRSIWTLCFRPQHAPAM